MLSPHCQETEAGAHRRCPGYWSAVNRSIMAKMFGFWPQLVQKHCTCECHWGKD